MCSEDVVKLLNNQGDEYNGTSAFLQMMQNIIRSFLSKTEPICHRVYLMWYCVFFCRLWSSWLHEQKNYTITKNFISLNSYLCVELNAHALIQLIRLYRDSADIRENSQFTPWLFSSQPCEQIF